MGLRRPREEEDAARILVQTMHDEELPPGRLKLRDRVGDVRIPVVGYRENAGGLVDDQYGIVGKEDGQSVEHAAILAELKPPE